jgi:hypothetical protein
VWLVIGLLLCFFFWVAVVARIVAAMGGDLNGIGATVLAVVLTFLLGFVAGTPK